MSGSEAKPLRKLNEPVCWMAIVSATITLSIGLGNPTAARSAHQAPVQQAEEIGTVQQIYDGTLYPDIQVQTFRDIDRLFPTRTVKRGTHVYPLPKSEAPLKGVEITSAGKKYDIYDYISLNRVSGLLILKNGKIVFERYELGNKETTRWMSMSVVKSITSTLIGIAIKDRYIKSIDDPVTKYLPALVGSAYEGVTIRNLVQMASGVKWDETYTNPASDRRRFDRGVYQLSDNVSFPSVVIPHRARFACTRNSLGTSTWVSPTCHHGEPVASVKSL